METTRPALKTACEKLPAPARMPREWTGEAIAWPSEDSIAEALWYKPVTGETATVAWADKADKF